MAALFISSTSFPSGPIQNSQNSDKRTKNMYLLKSSTVAGRFKVAI